MSCIPMILDSLNFLWNFLMFCLKFLFAVMFPITSALLVEALRKNSFIIWFYRTSPLVFKYNYLSSKYYILYVDFILNRLYRLDMSACKWDQFGKKLLIFCFHLPWVDFINWFSSLTYSSLYPQSSRLCQAF